MNKISINFELEVQIKLLQEGRYLRKFKLTGDSDLNKIINNN